MQLPGYDSKFDKIGGVVIEQILDREGIKLSDFKVSSYPEISCRGTQRDAIIYPSDFKINSIKKDKYKISFSLPKGSYATIVLRELIL